MGYPAVGTGSDALPAETVTTGYTSLGLASTLTSSLASYVSATSYTNYGQLAGRTYGTGSLTASRTYGWDQATGWLTNITTTVTNNGTVSTPQNDTYGYDNAGNVAEIDSTAGTAQQQCFSYDGLSRLTAAFTTQAAALPATAVANCGSAAANHTGGTSPYDLSYSYDAKGLGNLSSVADKIAGTTAAYSYPADTASNPADPHGVTSVTHKTTATGTVTGTDSYAYNGAGDLSSRTIGGAASTLTWTPQLQLASVKNPAGTTGYVYDASGSLLLRTGPSASTLYLPGEELTLTSGAVVPTRYYSSGGATVAMRVGGGGTNGTLTWLTADGQDSSQVAVNAATGATTEQRYLPFGAQRGTQGPTAGTQDGYLGHPYDPGTDLVQDGARFYDPGLGRFLSPDPIQDPDQPQDLDAYSYSMNNPTTESDPTGLFALNCELGSRCNPANDKNDSPTKVVAQGCNAACKRQLALWQAQAAARQKAAAASAARAAAAAAAKIGSGAQSSLLAKLAPAPPQDSDDSHFKLALGFGIAGGVVGATVGFTICPPPADDFCAGALGGYASGAAYSLVSQDLSGKPISVSEINKEGLLGMSVGLAIATVTFAAEYLGPAAAAGE
jgi:RHS repeat-associated protein